MAEYRVIDADGHFSEPSEMWLEYLAKKYRPYAPRRVMDNQGRMRSELGGRMSPYIPMPPKTEKPGKGKAARNGGNDPELRIKDMDSEGIDVMAVFPTKGLLFYSIKRLDVFVALCEAYNNWANDFTSHNPQRLIAPALLPQLEPLECIQELERVQKNLNLTGVFMRPNEINGRTLCDTSWSHLWSMLEEADIPLILHEGTTQNVPQAGSHYDNFLFRHMCSHAFEQQMGLMSLIMGGVLERHPKLRVMIVECGVAWVPYWLHRMDDHQEEWGHASFKLPTKPSEYFKRQCYVAAESFEQLVGFTVDAIGDDNICFSTDYPHPDHPFEGCVASIADDPHLSEESKRKILGGNSARFFGI